MPSKLHDLKFLAQIIKGNRLGFAREAYEKAVGLVEQHISELFEIS